MTYEPLAPFKAWSGPMDAKLVIIGEAWGRNEHEVRKPFVGESGKELFRMLGEAFPLVAPELHLEIVNTFKYDRAWVNRRDAWLREASVAFTNTLNFRPYNNDFKQVCLTKKELPPGYTRGLIETGQYLDPQYFPELERLEHELRTCQPNLVLCTGSKAAWALLDDTKISQIRGSVAMSTMIEGLKVLSTYHPAAVMRKWDWRPIVVVDLMKASREMHYADFRRPSRKIIYSPLIDEIEHWVDETITGPYSIIGADTETVGGQIEMISFARANGTEAISIPFIDKTKPGWSFWQNPENEMRAWNAAAKLLEAKIDIVWQNGLYDLQYILPLGISANATDDTMLLHHSILPEVQKGLGFLGAAYTNEPSWKLMRTRKSDTVKRDE